MQPPSQEDIEKIILENYVEYQYLFIESQSKFLSGLHNRYQGVENGNLVLYFAKDTHQDILRFRDYDLNFNISYEKFWENHLKINPKQKSIIKIALDVNLPKETARRKILQLTKQNVLNKKNKNIGWLPNEQYKQNYNLFISKEIDDACKLITFVCEKINFPISKLELAKELRDKFSFYWFHYLGTQLQYLRLWNKQFKDRELILIFLQIAHLFTSKAKKKNLSHKKLYDDPSLVKNFISASISATSISEVINVPRATCVRKLNFLTEMKIISKDKISKRYYIIPETFSDSSVSRKTTREVVKSFSNFFFICIKALSLKISS